MSREFFRKFRPTKSQATVSDDEKDEDEDIEDDSASEAIRNDRFEEVVDRLRSYSSVSIGEDRRTFEIHGLVQRATRNNIIAHSLNLNLTQQPV